MPLNGLALKSLLLPGQHHTRNDHGTTIALIHFTSSLLFSLERSSAERPSNVLSHLQKAGIIWWE